MMRFSVYYLLLFVHGAVSKRGRGGRGGRNGRNRGGGVGAPVGGSAPAGGFGGGGGRGNNRGHREVIQNLLDNHEKIQIDVVDQEDGVFVQCTSTYPEVSGWIQTHVQQMFDIVESGGNIRRWDPLFAKLSEHRYAFTSDLVLTEGGVNVTQTAVDATDDCVVDLVQWHADAVELFVALGREEARNRHTVPGTCNTLV
eukprot:scaffold2954_cov171-Amphora_coffeaeformis.AAC.4